MSKDPLVLPPDAFMPSFHRFPDEAAIIGRLLVGYGELELMFTNCLVLILKDQDMALRTVFRLRSETSRLDVIDALTRDAYTRVKLADQYAQTFEAMEWCKSIRNQFAHCAWGDDRRRGLMFINLDPPARKRAGFRFDWRFLDLDLLKEHESYFFYTSRCLSYLECEYRIRERGKGLHGVAMPRKRQPPKTHKLREMDTPP